MHDHILEVMPQSLFRNEKIELEYFTRGSSKMVFKMVVASLVTNACIVFCISVLKLGTMKPHEITFVVLKG